MKLSKTIKTVLFVICMALGFLGNAFAVEQIGKVAALDGITPAQFSINKSMTPTGGLLGYEIKNKYGGGYAHEPGSSTGISVVSKLIAAEFDKTRFQAMSEQAYVYTRYHNQSCLHRSARYKGDYFRQPFVAKLLIDH